MKKLIIILMLALLITGFRHKSRTMFFGGTAPVESGDSVLLETGDYLLLESGDKLLLE